MTERAKWERLAAVKSLVAERDRLRTELKAAQERAEREAEAFRILSRECERIDADRSSLRAELAALKRVAEVKP